MYQFRKAFVSEKDSAIKVAAFCQIRLTCLQNEQGPRSNFEIDGLISDFITIIILGRRRHFFLPTFINLKILGGGGAHAPRLRPPTPRSLINEYKN